MTLTWVAVAKGKMRNPLRLEQTNLQHRTQGRRRPDRQRAGNLQPPRPAQDRQRVLCGVHLNMCVLGRPFAIRQQVMLAKTSPSSEIPLTPCKTGAPHGVDHFTGTDLVIGHVEKYWCPSLTSDAIRGGKPFKFARIVGNELTQSRTQYRNSDAPRPCRGYPEWHRLG